MWPFIKKTPLRLQINPIECGAMALAIVLEYYGKKVPSSVLNELAQVSRNGSDAQSLVRAAKLLGFKTKAKRGLVNDLKGQELAILFFDSCHFVVFEGVYAGRFYINDPASGRYALTREELRRRFSGVYITLLMPRANALKARLGIKDASSKMAMLLYGLSLGLIFGTFALAIGALGTSGPSLGLEVGSIVLLLCLLFITLAVSLRFLLLMVVRSEQQSVDLLAALKRVRSSFFLTRPFVRFEAACKKVSTPTADHHLIEAKLFGIVIVLLAMAFVIAWPFALLVLAAALLSVLILLKGSDAPSAVGFDLLTISFEQSWNNYPDIEAMGQSAFLEHKQMEHEQRLLTKDNTLDKLRALSLSSLPCFVCFIALFAIANSAQGFSIAFNELVSVLLLSMGIFFCSYLIAFHRKARDALSDTASFIAEIKSEAMVKEETKDHSQSDAPLIAIKDASFRYAGEDALLLSSVNVSIFPHRSYGVLGPPQAGTSTLLKLMAQKMPWTEGIMEFRSRRFAIIDEEAELFHGSLWDNVTLFDARINEQQVVKALYQASIEELFLRRPQGLLTLIEEQGKNISVGQKKRLLLARALVQKAELIVLDDFFDTLDDALSEQILTTCKKLPLTLVFSSWRFSELAACDQVIMLGQGAVEAVGTHAELLDHESYKALIGLGNVL